MSKETKQSNELEQIIEKVNLIDDLSTLDEQERSQYYNSVCEMFGLNPATRPFAFINFEDSGKLKLYALRSATDQLRRIHDISVTIVRQETIGNSVYSMTARAKTADGRIDEAVGAVPLADDYGNYLSPRNMSNAIMTCQTKAIRRATLSICGITMLDESEVGDIPNIKLLQNPLLENTAPADSSSLEGLEPAPFETITNENKSEEQLNNPENKEQGSNSEKQSQWIEEKGLIESIEEQEGRENQTYHVVKIKIDDTNTIEVFAISKISQALREYPIEIGTEVQFKGNKTQKGILLHALEVVQAA